MNGTDAARRAVLEWYDRHRRHLAWRAPPGVRPDPYRVWLSEIMLQQTTVAVVERYFRDFTARWPDVASLAAAPDGEVMKAWAGLGYYARARNLVKCARTVTAEHGGRFPDTEDALGLLPGIGPYTAAAIAAIAFGRPAAVVDGNVERVVARYFAVREALPAAKPRLRALAGLFADTHRPGDFAQATMDLGALVCTPGNPDCARCPLAPGCRARKEGIEGLLPARAARPDRPTRRGVAFWVERDDGTVLLRRRPPKGLLGGMSEVPSTPWQEGKPAETATLAAAPIGAEWLPAGRVEHTFTHFHLVLEVWRANAGARPRLRRSADPASCFWVGLDDLDGEALPSVMRKVAAVALEKQAGAKARRSRP